MFIRVRYNDNIVCQISNILYEIHNKYQDFENTNKYPINNNKYNISNPGSDISNRSSDISKDRSIYEIEKLNYDLITKFKNNRLVFNILNNYIDLIKPKVMRYNSSNFSNYFDNYGKCINIFRQDNEKYYPWLLKSTILNPSKYNMVNTGGDWHRDSIYPSVKTILYLDDVGIDNGPTQIYPNSRFYYDDNELCDGKKQTLLKISKRDDNLHDKKIHQLTKYDNNLIKKYTNKKYTNILVNKGDLLLFDVSSIHRGCPIKSGERKTIQTFFFKGMKTDIT